MKLVEVRIVGLKRELELAGHDNDTALEGWIPIEKGDEYEVIHKLIDYQVAHLIDKYGLKVPIWKKPSNNLLGMGSIQWLPIPKHGIYSAERDVAITQIKVYFYVESERLFIHDMKKLEKDRPDLKKHRFFIPLVKDNVVFTTVYTVPGNTRNPDHFAKIQRYLQWKIDTES